ncbi:2-dehydropantoate 2-reductase [Pelagibius sp. Alg239-R121]|uniref:2-dehydropantoate 2-reductase n=1 Tax=Pelagibius sp. Alg239-R121 TaxID=2993448 RepID=UPI0024A70C98|nr:2-dehydropantoate 2-reductase [Pelagibius sp. Alg239-R121]
MRILVLGAGGTGGYFGGRLAEGGADVTFLVRARRAEELGKEGLRIESPFGNAELQVKSLRSDQIDAPYDLILLSCKAYHLEQALEDIAPAVGEGSLILPLLNGMAHIDRLVDRFGNDKVLGGLCHLAVTLTGDGLVKHMSKLHRVTFGELDGTRSERCEAVAALLEPAGFDSKLSERIRVDLWKKWALLTTLAGMTCLMRSGMDAVVETKRGAGYTRAMLEECVAVADAEGFALGQKFLDDTYGFLTNKSAVQKSSMLRDMENGAEVEADHIVGDMVSRGDNNGIDTPMLDMAYCHLQAYVASRVSGDG